MRLSIIVPAWNEERYLPDCLAALGSAISANALGAADCEIIVVDNNSTDRTADVARGFDARVVFEPVNQIGRARNSGAAQAGGEWLLFVDADSTVSAPLLGDILAVTRNPGAVGCGSVMRMGGMPWWARGLLGLWTTLSVLCRWAAGSLLLCRAEAFRDVGGFSTRLYAAEEVDLSRRLKRWGRTRGQRFIILRRHPLVTSNRKLVLYSGRELGSQLLRLMLRPLRALRDPKALSIWYDGRR